MIIVAQPYDNSRAILGAQLYKGCATVLWVEHPLMSSKWARSRAKKKQENLEVIMNLKLEISKFRQRAEIAEKEVEILKFIINMKRTEVSARTRWAFFKVADDDTE